MSQIQSPTSRQDNPSDTSSVKVDHIEKQPLEVKETDSQLGLPDFIAAVQAEWPSADFNPHNWPWLRRHYTALLPTLLAFICTFGSSVITPGIPEIASEFHVPLINAELTLSLYVLGLASGPVLAAPLSETFGRRSVYIGTFFASCLMTLGTSFSTSISSVLVCRFFAGFFSGPSLALGSATIADVLKPMERALSAALFAGSAFLGPLMGPLISGFVIEKKSWRWSMWLVLFLAAVALPLVTVSEETHKPTIMKNIAYKWAKEHGIQTKREEETGKTSNANYREATTNLYSKVAAFLSSTLGTPLRLLFTELILFSFSIYISFCFGVFYGFFGAFPLVFEGTYGFSTGMAGLAWIGLLIGLLIALGAVTSFNAYFYLPMHRRARERAVTEGKDPSMVQVEPENRLYPAIFLCVCMPVSLFWFGWTARSDVHWISPIVASAFFSIGNFSVFVSGTLYLIDTYGPALGASAMAANGLARYIFACSFPLFSRQMYARLGVGWASSLLGFVSLALCAVPLIFFFWGRRIREMSGRTEIAN